MFKAIVSPSHRAAICQLHDLGYKPFHMAAVFPYKVSCISTIIKRLKPYEAVELKDIPEAVRLMTGQVKFRKGLLSPYEYSVLKNEGLDAYLVKTGRSELSVTRAYFTPSGSFYEKERFHPSLLKKAVFSVPDQESA